MSDSQTDQPSPDSLVATKCVPCEGGVERFTRQQSEVYCRATPRWHVDEEGTRITRKVNCKHFVEAVSLLNQIAELAEQQQHHPDLHLTGYRHLTIVLTTHAIGGLSENDFIVAAHIDRMLDRQ